LEITMQLKTITKSFLFGAFIWFFSINAFAEMSSQNDPVALLKYVANNMISGLKANKATLKSKPQTVYNLANKFVVPYAAMSIMSKHVLPPHIWNSASAEQKSQFEKEFTRTLIRTYASALTSYRDQTIQFYPIRGDFQKAKTVE